MRVAYRQRQRRMTYSVGPRVALLPHLLILIDNGLSDPSANHTKKARTQQSQMHSTSAYAEHSISAYAEHPKDVHTHTQILAHTFNAPRGSAGQTMFTNTTNVCVCSSLYLSVRVTNTIAHVAPLAQPHTHAYNNETISSYLCAGWRRDYQPHTCARNE